jgi:hypothetical protein
VGGEWRKTVLAGVLQMPLGARFSSLLLKPTCLIKEGLHRKPFVRVAQNRFFFFFKRPISVFTLSYSGLSPANDTGAKKKKKKQKKKKEKGNETDSTQDQPVKVTRKLCFLVTDESILR